MITVLWVALAGGAGALLRYGIILAMPRRDPSSFPRATLLANVTGSFVAGLTLGFLLLDVVTFDVAVLIWVGLCGGLTTFSTFAVESVQIAAGRWRTARLNVALTIVLSIAACGLGLLATELAFGR